MRMIVLLGFIRLKCFELNKIGNIALHRVELYKRHLTEFDGKKISLAFINEHVMAVSEDERLIYFI
jgi:hypothetical protein